MIERDKPYHKTTAVTFASRLLQIGDDQWPHANDVGYNVHKMRHTQVNRQNGLSQSGAREHPITCLSAFRPIDHEFGQGNRVQNTDHIGSCPLQTAFEQAKIKTWVVN